jgi:hypothetical protein
MVKTDTSRALHNGSLASREIGAAFGGPSPAGKTAVTPTPMMPHGYTLQLVISIIKSSQQKSPLS